MIYLIPQNILIFLINRISLINNLDFKNTINRIISKNLNFNFTDLTNETPDAIIEQFENNTKVLISLFTNLSETMISNDDIEINRKNITILFRILNETYTNKPNKLLN